MHDNYAKILVVVWSNDVAIPPCGFADDPLITIAYKEDDPRIRVRTALYSHRLNDLLYTIRVAYDDTSYIIVPEWGSSEPFEFSAHLTDDEVMHSLTFFDDIILAINDYSFYLYKEGIKDPIFQSYNQKNTMITCGAFSPFRAGMIIIGRSDGFIDIWDFMDQTHKETMSHSVVACGISCIRFNQSKPNVIVMYFMFN